MLVLPRLALERPFMTRKKPQARVCIGGNWLSFADVDIFSSEVIHSGGGFSNNFAMPSYQKPAVNYWWHHFKPPYSSKQFNTSGKTRGYPVRSQTTGPCELWLTIHSSIGSFC